MFRPLNLRHGSANERMMPTSSEMAASAPGRCTFTATASVEPSEREMLPLYTCPRLADAMGAAESASFFAFATPSSASRMRRASASSKGGTASCSVRSSRMYAFGSRSWRLLSTCPSFTYVGPSDTSRSRSCAARFASTAAFRASLGSSPSTLRSSHSLKPNEPSKAPLRAVRRRNVSGRRGSTAG